MMRADVPHMFLKDLSLTTISVPASINLVMCLSIVSEAWCWGFHVSGNMFVGLCWRWWPMPVHFIISEGGFIARLGYLSTVGWRFISPLSTFLITSYRLIVLVLLLPGCMIPILPLCVSGICPDVWITPTLWGVSQRSRFHVWARRIEWGFSTGCK